MSGFPTCLQVQYNAAVVLSIMSQHEDNMMVLNTEQDRLEAVLTQAIAQFPECQQECRTVLKVLVDGLTE